MATPASKNHSSCSPILGKHTNSNPMRRSFGGNPFAKPSISANQRPGFNPNTPANSPSDYLRRNSIAREAMTVFLHDSEDKENVNKDQNSKQSKIRSPVSLKNAKHFMSPTISAASKINSSPRKKILTERNEAVPSSISVSDGKSSFKEDLSKKKKKEVSFDLTITYLEDKENLENDGDFDSSTNYDVDSSLHSFTIGNDCVNLDPSFNISPRTACSSPISALAPLEADPSMPPYDPKTNYLSPRPQFLHYKPNPRIELYLNKERDGQQLDEIFASESSTEAEVTQEENGSDDSQEESEGSSSGFLTEEEENGEVENEEQKVSKPKFFTRTKFTALLFIWATTCIWASLNDSPVMDPSVLNNLNLPNLYVLPEISEFTRWNFESLTWKSRGIFYDWLSYIHNLIISFKEWHKPCPLQFANLSTLLEDGLVDNNFILVAHSSLKYGNKADFGMNWPEEQEVQTVDSDENVDDVADADQAIKAYELTEVEEEETNDAGENIEEDQQVIVAHDCSRDHMSEFDEVNLIPQDEMTKSGGLVAGVIEEIVETGGDASVNQPVPIPQAVQIQPEVPDSRNFLAETDMVSTEIESARAELESLDSDAAMEISPFSAKITGISLLLCLIAAAFIRAKNGTLTGPEDANSVDKIPQTKRQFGKSPLSMITGQTCCPSVTSSFQSGGLSYYSKQGQKGLPSEAHSHERKPKKSIRRESMTLSDCSMESPSYGSFTTYEKITTNKHGNCEDEWLTPVRRSSRIRNQVTSP